MAQGDHYRESPLYCLASREYATHMYISVQHHLYTCRYRGGELNLFHMDLGTLLSCVGHTIAYFDLLPDGASLLHLSVQGCGMWNDSVGKIPLLSDLTSFRSYMYMWVMNHLANTVHCMQCFHSNTSTRTSPIRSMRCTYVHVHALHINSVQIALNAR